MWGTLSQMGKHIAGADRLDDADAPISIDMAGGVNGAIPEETNPEVLQAMLRHREEQVMKLTEEVSTFRSHTQAYQSQIQQLSEEIDTHLMTMSAKQAAESEYRNTISNLDLKVTNLSDELEQKTALTDIMRSEMEDLTELQDKVKDLEAEMANNERLRQEAETAATTATQESQAHLQALQAKQEAETLQRQTITELTFKAQQLEATLQERESFIAQHQQAFEAVNQVVTLQQQVEELLKGKQSLEQQLEDHQAELDSHMAVMTAKQEAEGGYRKEINELREQLAQLEDEKTQYAALAEAAQHQLADFNESQTTIQQLKEEVESRRQSESSLQTRFENMRAEAEGHLAVMQARKEHEVELRNTITELQSSCESHTNSIADLQTRLAEANQQLEGAQNYSEMEAAMQAWKDRAGELDSTLQQNQQTIAQYEAKLHQSVESEKHKTQQAHLLQNEVSRLQQLENQYKDEIARLQQRVNSLEASSEDAVQPSILDEYKQKLAVLERDHSSLLDTSRLQSEELETSQQLVQQHESSITELQAAVATLQRANTELEVATEQHQQLNNHLTSQVEQLQQQFSECSEQSNTTMAENQAHLNTIQAHKQEAAATQQQVDALTAHNAELTQNISALQTEINTLNEKVCTGDNTISRQQEEINRHASTLQSQQALENELQQALSAWQQRAAELESSLHQAQAIQNDKTEQLKQSKESIEQLNNMIQSLQDDVSTSQNKELEYKEELHRLKQGEHEKIEEANDQTSSVLESYKERVVKLDEQLRQSRSNEAKASRQIDTLQEQNSDVSTQLSGSMQMQQEQLNKIQQLHQQLSEADNTAHNLNESIVALNVQVNEKQQQIEQSNTEQDALQKQILEYQSTIQAKTATECEAQQAFAAWEARVNELEAALATQTTVANDAHAKAERKEQEWQLARERIGALEKEFSTVETLKQTEATLTQQLNDLHNLYNAESEKTAALQTQLNDITEQLQGSVSRESALKQERDSYMTSLQSRQQADEEKDAALQAWQHRANDLEHTIQKLQHDAPSSGGSAQQEQLIERLKHELNTVTTQVHHQLESILQTTTTHNTDSSVVFQLREIVNQFEVGLKHLSGISTYDELRNMADCYAAESAAVRSELAQVKAKADMSTMMNTDSAEEIGMLRQVSEHRAAEIATLQEEMKGHMAVIEAKQQHEAQFRDDIQTLRQTNRNLENEVRRLQSTLDATGSADPALKDSAHLKYQLDSLQTTCEQLQGERDSLIQKATARDTHVQELQTYIGTVRSQYSQLEEHCTLLQQQLQAAHDQTQTLQLQLFEAQQQLQQQQHSIATTTTTPTTPTTTETTPKTDDMEGSVGGGKGMSHSVISLDSDVNVADAVVQHRQGLTSELCQLHQALMQELAKIEQLDNTFTLVQDQLNFCRQVGDNIATGITEKSPLLAQKQRTYTLVREIEVYRVQAAQSKNMQQPSIESLREENDRLSGLVAELGTLIWVSCEHEERPVKALLELRTRVLNAVNCIDDAKLVTAVLSAMLQVGMENLAQVGKWLGLGVAQQQYTSIVHSMVPFPPPGCPPMPPPGPTDQPMDGTMGMGGQQALTPSPVYGTPSKEAEQLAQELATPIQSWWSAATALFGGKAV